MFIRKPLFSQYAVVMTVNLSVVILALGLAWPSPVLVKLRNPTETVLPRPITEEEGSWMVSIGYLTGCFALFLPAYLVDNIGRKYSVIAACVPRLIVCLLYTFASEVWMLLLGRGITGVIDCLVLTVVPMYASEIASSDVRGSLGTILQIFSSIGFVIMLSMGPFISYLTLNIIFTSLTAIGILPLLFLPDSPYFMYSKGRTPEALKVLTYLRGSEELASAELKEYALATTEIQISTRELFSNRLFLKTVGIVMVLGAGFQLIGFNAVTFYLQTILESTQTSIRPEVASVIIGCIQLTASLCTAFTTDRFGRKPILTVTLIGMSLGMLGLGVFFKIRSNSTDTVSGIMNFVPLGSLILVVFAFSAGPGSLSWLLVAELFEGPARATGVGCSLLCTMFSLFFTTKYFPMLTTSIGAAATYWIFGVNCILLCLFILFCVPETKGKSFSEIQVSLGANVDPVYKNKNIQERK
ncbi:sugar transporter domain-containing protein [Phthorimaea operculella]|nr:sugar transporter domain-containing protein [Phthorimaea operculella]